MPQIPKTPRPFRHSNEVRNRAAELLFPRVLEWCNSEDDRTDEGELLELLQEAFNRHDLDGYALARDLDGDLRVNAALVEILDDAAFKVDEAFREIQAEWMKDSGLTPPQSGATVRWFGRSDAGEGIVTAVDEATGRAAVRFPALGHVDVTAPGFKREKSTYTTAAHLNWEEIETI